METPAMVNQPMGGNSTNPPMMMMMQMYFAMGGWNSDNSFTFLFSGCKHIDAIQ